MVASYISLSVVHAYYEDSELSNHPQKRARRRLHRAGPGPSRMRHLRKDGGRGHRMSRDAITGYVESLIEDGEPVPMEDDLIECRVTVEAHA
jgi:hypothetical protein